MALTAKLFHLFWGTLELVAYEERRQQRIFGGCSSIEALLLLSGLGRLVSTRAAGDAGAVHISHFLVHAAAFLEATKGMQWAVFEESVQQLLVSWGEDRCPESHLRHAVHNLFIDLDGGPVDDGLYDAVRAGCRAIRSEGREPQETYQSWLDVHGWRKVDEVLPVLSPHQQRPFFQYARRWVLSQPESDRFTAATRLGFVDQSDQLLLGGPRKRGMPILSFAGGPGIGRSCILYEAGGVRLAIDAGGDAYGRYPTWSPSLERIDAVLLTHAHHDHIGGLLHLFGELGYRGPVYAHETTIRCARLALEDSLRLRAGETDEDGVNDSTLLEQIVSRGRKVESGVPFVVGDVRITPFDAGHVRGSLQFLLEVDAGPAIHRTLVSGDFNPEPSLSVAPIAYPSSRDCDSLDVLIVEGTYALSTEPIETPSTCARSLVGAIAQQERRPVLLPVMSLGRAQEVLAALERTPWRVAVCGLAARMTQATAFPVGRNINLERRWRDIARDEFEVIVASAGCLQGGPSRYFLEESGWDMPVILTGHLFPGTPAHASRDAWQRVRYSGHASPTAWAGYVARFPNAMVFLVHSNATEAQGHELGFIVPRSRRLYDIGQLKVRPERRFAALTNSEKRSATASHAPDPSD